MPSSQAEYLSELSSKLSGYLSEYSPTTTEERQELRHVTSPERLKEFHRILTGELDKILEVLDRYHPDNKWSVGGFIRNITNTAAFVGGGEQSPYVPQFIATGILPPRTYGVNVRRSF